MGSRAGLVWLALFASCAAAAAQESEGGLRLKSLKPAGVRSHVSEDWSLLSFALANTASADKEARILTFFPGAPGRQYGCNVWAPAKAVHLSWSRLGPPPNPPEKSFIELKSLLYDRSSGRDELVRSPEGPPLHSELVSFHRREPATTLMLDVDIVDGAPAPSGAQDLARANEVRDLVRVFRHRQGWSSRVNVIKQQFLPPLAEGFDGIDHFVLGSDRIAEDAAGGQALRAWVERGGTLWVMLDLVQEATLASILGDALDVHVVDRISLTHFHLRGEGGNARRVDLQPTELEIPVDFVRILAPEQRVLYSINGWPAALVKEIGRGRVLITTLGVRGWMRPRRDTDPAPRYQEFPRLSVARVPFETLMDELHPRAERPPLAPGDLRAYVGEQIGYSVVSRDTVLFVFGTLFLALGLAALALGRRGLLEHLAWFGTSLALGTAGVFVGLGELSRSAVPATVAVAQLVDAVPGVPEAQASGFLGVFQPTVGAVTLGAAQGGDFDLDIADLAGRDQRRVQTDVNRWHWENLELPAGVREGTFRYTVRASEPIEATARFGPNGLEGRLTSGPFQQLEDLVVHTLGQRAVAVHLNADGTLQAGTAEELAPGQWLLGNLLSDRQRARQLLYDKLLADPLPRFLANRNLLFAWATPVDMHFTLASDARTTGTALLMIPLRFERTAPGTRVTIPAAFVDCRRLTTEGQPFRPAVQGRDAATMRFRFQVPPSILPLELENARLSIKLTAAARDVAISGVSGKDSVPLRTVNSPLGVETIAIEDPRLLRLDEQGTIHFDIAIGAARGAENDQWRIESLGLEIRGQTLGEGSAKHELR